MAQKKREKSLRNRGGQGKAEGWWGREEGDRGERCTHVCCSSASAPLCDVKLKLSLVVPEENSSPPPSAVGVVGAVGVVVALVAADVSSVVVGVVLAGVVVLVVLAA